MFPQITEETEENLLNLEEDIPPTKSPPYSPVPPYSTCSSPPTTPLTPNHEKTVFSFCPPPNPKNAFCLVTEVNSDNPCRSVYVPLSSTVMHLMTKVSEVLNFGPEDIFEVVLKLPSETIHVHEHKEATLEELGFRYPLLNELNIIRRRECKTPPAASEIQVPSPHPVITTENADCNHRQTTSPPPPDDEFSTPPPRVRMRSLSGGAYRLAPSIFSSGRHRRQSGDDVLTRTSPSRKTSMPLQFRPRSKSDSKRPTFLTSLKNTFLGGSSPRKTSLGSYEPPRVEQCQCQQQEDSRHSRPRSGSETKGGTMSKVIDLFRSRSHSVSYDSRGKMVLPNSHSNDDTLGKKSRKRSLFQTQRSLDSHKRDYACHSEDETGDTRFDFGNLDEEKIVPSFLSSRTCYNAMPKSGKVIVLSTELLVKNAFSCLVTNEIRAAPLWESSTQTFIGMLTISDFINVLRHYYYSSKEDIKSIENQKILTWKKITNVTKPIIQIHPNHDLVEASKLLLQERIHRLPVYDEKRNSVLFILTRKTLLQYLHKNLLEKMGPACLKTPSFMSKTIGDLRPQIGSWENIAMVSLSTRVIDALDLFCERNVSALPVLDEENKLVDIFAKFDVFALAKEQTYDNLDMTVAEALDKAEVHEDVYGCTLDESLGTVIDRFVAAKVHRLVVVDEKQSVIGMLSLSDILKFLILEPLDDSGITSDTIDETPEGAIGGLDDSSVFLDSGIRSPNLQQSSSLEKQDSSDLSEEFVKLQMESQTPEVSASEN